MIEFSVLHSTDEGVPFAGRETEYGAVGVLAVTNADLTTGQVRNLDTVAVGETQGTLDPAWSWSWPAQKVVGRKFAHVPTSLIVVG